MRSSPLLSLPPEALLEIFPFLRSIELFKCRSVSNSLKEQIDSMTKKWIQDVADLSFLHVPRGLPESNDYKWHDILSGLTKYIIASPEKEDFHKILPETLDFFGETLILAESKTLQQASDEYLFLWCDYLRQHDQFDNYFVGLCLYKRPGTCDSDLPFGLESGDNKQIFEQYQELCKSVVHTDEYFGFPYEECSPNIFCRKLSADVLTNCEELPIVKLFLSNRNNKRNGCMIYAGRSFLASSALMEYLLNHSDPKTKVDENKPLFNTAERRRTTKQGYVMPKTKADISIPSLVVNALSDVDTPYWSSDDEDDTDEADNIMNSKTSPESKASPDCIEYDWQQLLPNDVSTEIKNQFVHDLSKAQRTSNESLRYKKQMRERLKTVEPTLAKMFERIPNITNRNLKELARIWHTRKLKGISMAIKQTGLMTPFKGEYYYEIPLTDCHRFMDEYYDGWNSNETEGNCMAAIVAKDAVMIVKFQGDVI